MEKKRKTRIRKLKGAAGGSSSPPLAGELVAGGFVAEERLEELTTYLAARKRFKSSFGVRSRASEALENLQRAAAAMTKQADYSQREIQALLDQFHDIVVPDLEVVLQGDQKTLSRIKNAVEALAVSQVPAREADRIRMKVDEARQAYDEVQEPYRQF